MTAKSTASRRRRLLQRVARLRGPLLVALVALVAFMAGSWLAAPAPGPGARTPGAASGGAATHQHAAPEGQTWTCSMHPQIRLPEPGDCPICGMDLIPVDKAAEVSPDEVSLSPEARTLARIRTTAVRRGRPTGTIRLLGKLEVDETRARVLTSWVAGRINRLFVSAEGTKVKRGQTLASVYSPEVYSAHADLILARKQLDRLAGALPVARKAAEAALEAAATRLELLGFGAKTVRKMAQASRPYRNISVPARYAGTVLEQLTTEGASVKAGEPLFRIADLDVLWIQLEAYETDLAHIQTGTKVVVKVAGVAGQLFEGTVSFIDPVVDPRSRTADVRVELENTKGLLRPGLFAEAAVERSDRVKDGLPLIPASAPLFTGRRSVVYVELPGEERPTYEAREVRLGIEQDGFYPVLRGLEVGERVVTHGAFTLDAELQIRGGDSMMSRADDRTRVTPRKLPDAARKIASEVLTAYLDLQQALAADDLAGSRKALEVVLEKAAKEPPLPGGAEHAWEETVGALERALKPVRGKDLQALRDANEPASQAMIRFMRSFPNPLSTTVHVAHCPMAASGDGASWIQRGKEVRNPYYGAEMLACGSVRGDVEPGTRAPHAHE